MFRKNKARQVLYALSLLVGILLIVFFYKEGEKISAFYFVTSVNPLKKEIVEIEEKRLSPAQKIGSFVYVAIEALFENAKYVTALATPAATPITIYPGVRNEEIAELLAKKMDWGNEEEKSFILLARANEGKFYPGTYVVTPDVKAVDLQKKMHNRFQEEVEERYKSGTTSVVSLETALNIASIIQREAAGKKDMRLISGVIWNRLFADMSLDMDATLQYIRGDENVGWWPKVNPEDKKIKSPYNTYLNKGLPPAPIASPSILAIEAAFNPRKTPCFFYLHDKKGNIHCSKTYEEHKHNIDKYY